MFNIQNKHLNIITSLTGILYQPLVQILNKNVSSINHFILVMKSFKVKNNKWYRFKLKIVGSYLHNCLNGSKQLQTKLQCTLEIWEHQRFREIYKEIRENDPWSERHLCKWVQ